MKALQDFGKVLTNSRRSEESSYWYDAKIIGFNAVTGKYLVTFVVGSDQISLSNSDFPFISEDRKESLSSSHEDQDNLPVWVFLRCGGSDRNEREQEDSGPEDDSLVAELKMTVITTAFSADLATSVDDESSIREDSGMTTIKSEIIVHEDSNVINNSTPTTLAHCGLCRLSISAPAETAESSFLTCNQCDRSYHASCMPDLIAPWVTSSTKHSKTASTHKEKNDWSCWFCSGMLKYFFSCFIFNIIKINILSV